MMFQRILKNNLCGGLTEKKDLMVIIIMIMFSREKLEKRGEKSISNVTSLLLRKCHFLREDVEGA